MSDLHTQLVYGLDDVPPPPKAALAAIQHVLASIVGIATPSLIIGGALGLGALTPYLIAMAFFVSGIATFIQCYRIGPVGSGLVAAVRRLRAPGRRPVRGPGALPIEPLLPRRCDVVLRLGAGSRSAARDW